MSKEEQKRPDIHQDIEVPHHDFSGDVSDLPVLGMAEFESSPIPRELPSMWDGDKSLKELAQGEQESRDLRPTPHEVDELVRKSLQRALGLDEEGRRS